MQKCPHCGKNLRLASDVPTLHMDRYVQPVVALTKCCKRCVELTPHIVYTAEASDKLIDDWGEETLAYQAAQKLGVT